MQIKNMHITFNSQKYTWYFNNLPAYLRLLLMATFQCLSANWVDDADFP